MPGAEAAEAAPGANSSGGPPSRQNYGTMPNSPCNPSTSQSSSSRPERRPSTPYPSDTRPSSAPHTNAAPIGLAPKNLSSYLPRANDSTHIPPFDPTIHSSTLDILNMHVLQQATQVYANPEGLSAQNAQSCLTYLANVEGHKINRERWNKIFWASAFFLFCAGQVWAEEGRRKEVARAEQMCTARWERFIKNGFKDVVEEDSRPFRPSQFRAGWRRG